MHITQIFSILALAALSATAAPAPAAPAPAADAEVDMVHNRRDPWDRFWCSKKEIDKCKQQCAAINQNYYACRYLGTCTCKRKSGGGGCTSGTGGGPKPCVRDVLELE